jgi:hypothetical protein
MVSPDFVSAIPLNRKLIHKTERTKSMRRRPEVHAALWWTPHELRCWIWISTVNACTTQALALNGQREGFRLPYPETSPWAHSSSEGPSPYGTERVAYKLSVPSDEIRLEMYCEDDSATDFVRRFFPKLISRICCVKQLSEFLPASN